MEKNINKVSQRVCPLQKSASHMVIDEGYSGDSKTRTVTWPEAKIDGIVHKDYMIPGTASLRVFIILILKKIFTYFFVWESGKIYIKNNMIPGTLLINLTVKVTGVGFQ